MFKKSVFSVLLFLLLYSTTKADQIVLIGTDSKGSTSRSDADFVLIITIKENEIKTTALMKDTYVYVKGFGNQKLGAAYRLGGNELLISTINANFKTKLTSSIVADFDKIASAIDSFGGLSFTINKNIHHYVNAYIRNQSYLKDTPALPLTRDGNLKLSGPQSLAYARVVVPGTAYDDYARIERQKNITKTMLTFAMKNKSLAFKNSSHLLALINTNLNLGNYFEAVMTFLNKPSLPKSQVFPIQQHYTRKMISNKVAVLKIINFDKAAVSLNKMIE